MEKRLFDTTVQELKYKVLKEVVSLELKDELDTKYHKIPQIIITGPKATMRCCIYHERAIVEERVALAMGGDPENPNVVEVIDSACDECPVKRFSVTDACRGCIAHRCQSVCPVGAISTDKHKSVIDHEKCIECGQCMKACPYHAIIESPRPCVKGCEAKAISIDTQKKAVIQNEKCTGCGECVTRCPFGAIVDKSFVVDVLRMLKGAQRRRDYRVYAVLAPSFAGQFTYATPGQIVAGIKELGFHAVVEAALGADLIAGKESGELAEKGFLMSSCCPSFVKYVEINFPDLAQHISHNISPMAETARQIKLHDPSARVVFIGPCVSKKAEFRKTAIQGMVDSVLTFEELQAMFDGTGISVGQMQEAVLDDASVFGRNFACSGGVTAAIRSVIHQKTPDFDFKPEICDGIEQCRIALLKARSGKLEKNFIEGMACVGGCIGGAACLTHGVKNTAAIAKYGQQASKKSIE